MHVPPIQHPTLRLMALLSDERGEARTSIAGIAVLVIGALFVAWFIWTQIRFWVLVAIVVAATGLRIVSGSTPKSNGWKQVKIRWLGRGGITSTGVD